VRCGSCGSGSLGRSASEPGRFMSRGRGPRGGCPPPEGVDVAYPRTAARKRFYSSRLTPVSSPGEHRPTQDGLRPLRRRVRHGGAALAAGRYGALPKLPTPAATAEGAGRNDVRFRRPALEFLRIYFGKSAEGVWAVQGLKSIPLKSGGTEGGGLFAIEDDLVVAQPSFLETVHFALGQSIVPMVALVPEERVLRCLGTGFFISCTGLLVTAAHVITDPIEREYGGVRELEDRTWYFGDLKLGVMIPLNPVTQGHGYIFRDIEWASFIGERSEHPLPIAGIRLNLTSDTAICKVSPIAEGVPYQPLSIVQSGVAGTGMAVGRTATAIGYVGMRDVELAQESENVISGEFSFELHVSTGAIVERFPDNLTTRVVPTPGACFSASIKLPAGMSGSPIFDDEMIYVHGVVSRGWVDQDGVAPLGFGSMLSHSLRLPIRPLNNRTLLDLHGSPDHGFPRFRAPNI